MFIPTQPLPYTASLFCKTLALCFIILLGAGKGTVAQSTELGLSIGTTVYKGELNHDLADIRFHNLAGGINFRKNLNDHWALNASLLVGKLIGADSLSESLYDVNRNLSFQSGIAELAGRVEFNFFPYQIGSGDWPFTPFLFIGFSAFRFNPKGELNGNLYELQPLGTEGQGSSLYPDRKKYKRTQVAIPYGGGFKFSVSKRIGINIEAGVRKTYSDYLDDVSLTYADRNILLIENGSLSALLSDKSPNQQLDNFTGKQRGNSQDYDKFMYTGITFAFRLGSLTNDKCEPFMIR